MTARGSGRCSIGGGSGVPALYMACRELVARGARPVAALGFNSASESFYADDFAALGAETAVYTADGSLGAKRRRDGRAEGL